MAAIEMAAIRTPPVERPAWEECAAVLVEGARRGDRDAWTALVDRFLPLVRSVTRGYRLGDRDAEDVAQTVWLRLLEHLDRIREPVALPGWIAATARHEALRLARGQGRAAPLDPFGDSGPQPADERTDVDAGLLRAERDRAVRDGLAELPDLQRELLVLLTLDPPPSYRDISRRLGMPVGSIGPTRSRSLQRLRNTRSLRDLLDAPSPARRPLAGATR
ncbi:RNA polymerase sigma factor [Geodermatophilus sp. URMC 64]